MRTKDEQEATERAEALFLRFLLWVHSSHCRTLRKRVDEKMLGQQGGEYYL